MNGMAYIFGTKKRAKKALKIKKPHQNCLAFFYDFEHLLMQEDYGNYFLFLLLIFGGPFV